MRRTILATLLAAAFASQPAIAQQKADEHAGHHPEAQDTAPAGKGEASVRQLGENMKKIQDLMAQIHATSDPAARDELLKQHLKAMREQIGAMLAMAPGKAGMMGGGKGMTGEGESAAKEGMAEGDAPRDTPDAKKEGKGGGMMEKGMMMMMKMHKQMEGRVRMLELLLQQMLEREAVEEGVEHDH